MVQRPTSENTALDPTTLLLRRALWKALHLSVVPVALGASGCGGAISVEGFAKVSCDPIQDLMTSEDVDYVSLRYAEDFGGPARVTVLSEVGEPCKKAEHGAACLASLAAPEGLIDNNIGVDHGVTLYVATTRGDQVKNYDTPEKLTAWLGEIDTPDEAVLIAMLEAYAFDCKKKQNGAVKETSEGFALVGTMLTNSCPVETSRVLLQVSSEGEVRVKEEEELPSTSNACVGRRPRGLRERALLVERSVGGFFVQVARLEAASVHAFRQLARALTVHGAPAALIRQARQAARDEIRHARDARRIAARFGAGYVPPVIDLKPLPTLSELAHDNAVEGCVRETFGALYGMFQATQAEDLDVRRTMARIAADETRHASLALQVAEWLAPLLSADERAALERAQQRALIELEQELSESHDDDTLRAVAGVPSSGEARALLANLRRELWPNAQAA